jgi:hypothetical protein
VVARGGENPPDEHDATPASPIIETKKARAGRAFVPRNYADRRGRQVTLNLPGATFLIRWPALHRQSIALRASLLSAADRAGQLRDGRPATPLEQRVLRIRVRGIKV